MAHPSAFSIPRDIEAGFGGGGGADANKPQPTPLFGPAVITRQCFGAGSPNYGVCEMPCERQGSIGGTAVPFSELLKVCGPITKCPNIITQSTKFYYIFGIGFAAGGPTVTGCSPNGSVPGGILPENR